MANSKNEWELLWNARSEGLQVVFGKQEEKVYHSPVPLYLGGNADVLQFDNHSDGVAYVTADLTGMKAKANRISANMSWSSAIARRIIGAQILSVNWLDTRWKHA